MADKNVMFRRVNGHIIPIKLTAAGKRRVKDGAEGTALIAAGAAAGVATGKAHRSAVKFAATHSIRAFASLTKLDGPLRKNSLFAMAARAKGAPKVEKLTSKLFSVSKNIGRLTPGIRIGGQLAAAALIGAGLAKIYKARREKPKKGELSAVAAIGGTGAFLIGGYGGAGARQAFKATYVKAYPAIRAFKNTWKL